MKIPTLQIHCGDALSLLHAMPDASVQCVVTSPPYWGLRDYGVTGQLGQEKTPEEFVSALVSVFREVRRVLRDDGTVWLNIGDSYYTGSKGNCDHTRVKDTNSAQRSNLANAIAKAGNRQKIEGYKPKDLIGIPWRVAFALQADGWYLRSDIIWAKPNCMPESVTDRPTRSHEYIFLLTKRPRYYYDHEAIKEPPSPELLKQIAEGYNGHATKDFAHGMAQDASATKSRIIGGYRKRISKQRGHSRKHDGFNDRWDSLTKAEQMACGSNKRDVWTVAPANYPGSHFATYPPALIRPCILAGTRQGDTVLDPFAGSGTTGQVALESGRNAILIELNPAHIPLIEERCNITSGLPI